MSMFISGLSQILAYGLIQIPRAGMVHTWRWIFLVLGESTLPEAIEARDAGGQVADLDLEFDFEPFWRDHPHSLGSNLRRRFHHRPRYSVHLPDHRLPGQEHVPHGRRDRDGHEHARQG